MQQFETIQADLESNGALWIRFNRPQSYNAINFKLYEDLFEAINFGEENDNCKLFVLTGNGKYFSSGNDQENFMDPESETKKYYFRKLIDLLINLRKPLIGLVNGPAVGMGLTMLLHCDLVMSSHQATFTAPFTKLALVPEGCSSYLMPRIMGHARANEILMFNKVATAQELHEVGLISRVIPHDKFAVEAKKMVDEYAQLNGKALMRVKSLVKPVEFRRKLVEVNHAEVDSLFDSFLSPEALEIAIQFLARKSAKSKL